MVASDTHRPAEAGRLLPADISPYDVELEHVTLNVHTCTTTGRLHARPHCNWPCGPACDHLYHQDLEPTQVPLEDAEGRLCRCVGPKQADGNHTHTFKLLKDIGSAISSIHQQTQAVRNALHDTPADLTAAEALLAELLSLLTEHHRDALIDDNHDQFTEYTNRQFTQLRHTWPSLQTQLHSHTTPNELNWRMTAVAAVRPDQLQRSSRPHDTTLLAQDIDTILQHPNCKPSQIRLVESITRLRRCWTDHATRSAYDHTNVTQQLTSVLNNWYAPPANSHLNHTTAQQLADRWKTTTDTLLHQQSGSQRLVAAYHGLAWSYDMHQPFDVVRAAAAAHLLQPQPLGTSWQYLTLDTAAFQGLHAATIDDNYLIDCGPAEPLQQQAAAQQVKFEDVLQLLTRQHAEQDSDQPHAETTRIQTHALINALAT